VVYTQSSANVTNVHGSIDAQWLGSDCGSVKDIEKQQ